MKRIAFVAALAAASSARAEAPVPGQIVVSLGTAAPDDTPWSKQLKRLKARLEKDSGGRIKMKVFLGSVKGGEEAMTRQVAQGSLQCAGLTTAALALLAPELELFELPYLFRTQDEADKIMDDPEVWAIVKRILDKKGLVPYLWSENGWRNYASKKSPIVAPADIKGMKMRAQENRVHIETYKALGASPVPIAMPEVISSLQTGVVDGYDNTPLIALAASWYEGVKHWTVSDHIFQPALIIYNKKWLEAQPEDLRKILLSNQQEETSYGRGLIRKLTEPLLKNLSESGIKVHKLEPAQRDAFAAATRSVWDKIRREQSDEGKALLDLILKKLGRSADKKKK
jgi:tripartite ATP-independent transporter DctP family solute receptor